MAKKVGLPLQEASWRDKDQSGLFKWGTPPTNFCKIVATVKKVCMRADSRTPLVAVEFFLISPIVFLPCCQVIYLNHKILSSLSLVCRLTFNIIVLELRWKLIHIWGKFKRSPGLPGLLCSFSTLLNSERNKPPSENPSINSRTLHSLQGFTSISLELSATLPFSDL